MPKGNICVMGGSPTKPKRLTKRLTTQWDLAMLELEKYNKKINNALHCNLTVRDQELSHDSVVSNEESQMPARGSSLGSPTTEAQKISQDSIVGKDNTEISPAVSTLKSPITKQQIELPQMAEQHQPPENVSITLPNNDVKKSNEEEVGSVNFEFITPAFNHPDSALDLERSQSENISISRSQNLIKRTGTTLSDEPPSKKARLISSASELEAKSSIMNTDCIKNTSTTNTSSTNINASYTSFHSDTNQMVALSDMNNSVSSSLPNIPITYSSEKSGSDSPITATANCDPVTTTATTPHIQHIHSSPTRFTAIISPSLPSTSNGGNLLFQLIPGTSTTYESSSKRGAENVRNRG